MSEQEPKIATQIIQPSSDDLKDLAIYLEGMYKGQGNLLPLGKVHLENLWTTIKYLRKNNL